MDAENKRYLKFLIKPISNIREPLCTLDKDGSKVTAEIFGDTTDQTTFLTSL